jgi:diguanylate cyclase (GGDEF)-like protein
MSTSDTRKPVLSADTIAQSAAPAALTEDLTNLLEAVVMMVDDEPLNIEVTQVHLEEAGYKKFVSTSDPLSALDLLTEQRPDVLLLDLNMPGMSGFELLSRMAGENILKDVPTIVLTSSSDAKTKLKALELGATDFLSKPVDASELVLRLRNTLAAKAYRDRLAKYDALTGLPNRSTFMDRLEWSLAHAQRFKQKGAVLHLGLDKFKQINEALGPRVGDAVLQTVAHRLENCLRTTDTIVRLEQGPRPSLSRFSGDEFAVLLPAIRSGDDAARIAERIRNAIATPFRIGDHEVTATCSIGIAIFPDDGVKADQVVQSAGTAMHYAKASSNAFQFYSSDLNARALQKLHLTSELRKAIDRDELRLFYQPKFDIKSGVLVGAEALVRWQHPQQGLLFPDKFIPLAEENGLIVPLGEWVLREACRQSKAWLGMAGSVPRIAVNVSGHQFRQGRLPEVFAGAIRDTGARPEHLTLEITEGVLMESASHNVNALLELKKMQVKLSIDDFGTGYSSLSYLDKFPLDELKIDRSFVSRIKDANDRAAIITAIIAMAHSLGLTVVAEGVETEAQLAFLAAQGCDHFQGYLRSKAVPVDDFTRLFVLRNKAS